MRRLLLALPFALLPLVSTGPDADRVPGLTEPAWWVGAVLALMGKSLVMLGWRRGKWNIHRRYTDVRHI